MGKKDLWFSIITVIFTVMEDRNRTFTRTSEKNSIDWSTEKAIKGLRVVVLNLSNVHFRLYIKWLASSNSKIMWFFIKINTRLPSVPFTLSSLFESEIFDVSINSVNRKKSVNRKLRKAIQTEILCFVQQCILLKYIL